MVVLESANFRSEFEMISLKLEDSDQVQLPIATKQVEYWLNDPWDEINNHCEVKMNPQLFGEGTAIPGAVECEWIP